MPLEYRAGQWALDGEPVTAEQITELRDEMVAQVADELGQIAIEELGLPNGESDVRAAVEFPLGRIERFSTRFLGRVTDMITTAYTVARGGVGRVTDGGWRTVVDLVARQETFSQGFVAALREGTVSEAQAVARARLYAGSAIEAFEIAKADQVGFEAPVFPTQDCEGQVACRCWWEIQEFPDRFEGTWHAEGDRNTCGPCKQHAREFNPLVQRKTAEA